MANAIEKGVGGMTALGLGGLVGWLEYERMNGKFCYFCFNTGMASGGVLAPLTVYGDFPCPGLAMNPNHV